MKRAKRRINHSAVATIKSSKGYMPKPIFFFSLIVSAFCFARPAHAQETAAEQRLGQAVLHDQYPSVTLKYLAPNPKAPAYAMPTGIVGLGYHPGIDFRAVKGTSVYSPVDGTIASTGPEIGRVSIAERNTGRFVIFLHLSKLERTEGNVTVGDLIGESGDTAPDGGVTEHLHVEYRIAKEWGAKYFLNPKNTGVNLNPVLITEQHIIDTSEGTYSGVRFKTPGFDAIRALPFNNDADQASVLSSLKRYMAPPPKPIAFIFPMPLRTGVRLTVNGHSWQFSQVMVTSNEVKTSEGLGVGSSFEDWCKAYGYPTTRSIPGGRTQYTFKMPNTHLSAAIYDKDKPANYFIVAHDLK